MDLTPKIVRLEELALALDDELRRLADSLPGLKIELQGALAARVAELATANRLDGREAVREQCAAMRVELGAIAERHFAAVMAERQKLVGLGEITHTLTAFATKAAQQAMREFAAQPNGAVSDVVKRELAAYQPLTPAPLVPNFADVFRGNYDSAADYARGDIFAFRGGCYLVLKPSRGVLPTQQEQKGANPRYALLAAPGATGATGPALPTGSDQAFGSLTLSQNAIATTSTDGLVVQNTTPSTSGVTIQYSPRIRLTGHARNTTPTAADNQLDVIAELRPTSGTTPSGAVAWSFRRSTNGTGSFTDFFSFAPNSTSGGVTMTALITGKFQFNGIAATNDPAWIFNATSGSQEMVNFRRAGTTTMRFVDDGTGFYFRAGNSQIIRIGPQDNTFEINDDGTMTMAGSLAHNAVLAINSICVTAIQTLSGPGAVNVTQTTTAITTTGVLDALTLANGTNGMIKEIIHRVDGGSAVLTPTTATGFTTITFTNAGESAVLKYLTTQGWFILSLRGAVAA